VFVNLKSVPTASKKTALIMRSRTLDAQRSTFNAEQEVIIFAWQKCSKRVAWRFGDECC
jgi:hypothetical protein